VHGGQAMKKTVDKTAGTQRPHPHLRALPSGAALRGGAAVARDREDDERFAYMKERIASVLTPDSFIPVPPIDAKLLAEAIGCARLRTRGSLQKFTEEALSTYLFLVRRKEAAPPKPESSERTRLVSAALAAAFREVAGPGPVLDMKLLARVISRAHKSAGDLTSEAVAQIAITMYGELGGFKTFLD
jgi:hypothetical protein